MTPWPGGVEGPHGPPLLKHSTKQAPARANGKADRACRGRSQAPGAGESTPEINSPAMATAEFSTGNAAQCRATIKLRVRIASLENVTLG